MTEQANTNNAASGQPRRVRLLPLALESATALVLWASVPVVVRHIEANPFAIGIVRLALATFLIALFFVRRRDLRDLSARDWFGLAMMGGAFALHWGLYFFSIKIASASIGAIGLAGYGAFLILLSALLDRTRPGPVDLFAIGLCIGGSLLLVPEFDPQNNVVLGLLLGAGSSICFACLPILHRRFRHMPSGTRAFGQFGFGLPLFLCFWPLADFQTIPGRDWLWLAYLSVFCTFIGHSLWIRVTTVLQPATTGTIYYIYLPVSLGFSWTFLSEGIDLAMLAGAALIASGSILGIRSQTRRDRISSAARSPDSTAPSK